MTAIDGAADPQARQLADALACGRLEQFARGGESRTFRISGTDLLVSVPRTWPAERPEAADLASDAELLRRIRQRVAVPVPEVVRVVPDVGCTVVRLLPGTPMLGLPEEGRPPGVVVARELGTMLGRLHTWDAAAYDGLVAFDQHSPSEWRDETAAVLPGVRAVLTDAQAAAMGRFLSQPPPARSERRVLSHNDLGIEHVLVESGVGGPRVTGVIDWGDAAVTDPAYDFGLVHRDLGPAALDSALAAYAREGGDPSGISERARFYAVCTLVEDLAFGLTQDRAEYVDKSLAGWERTLSP